MANGLNTWHVVDAPPAVPYRYGLFSVVTPRNADLTAVGVDEHWRLGVTWQSQNCLTGDITQGACIDPGGPFTPELTEMPFCSVLEYDPFTAYVYNVDAVPGRTLEQHRQDAIDRLLINEQKIVETQLLTNISNCAAGDGSAIDLTDYPLDFALGWVEQALGNRYGGQGVIYMSRQTATLLWNNLRIEGGKLVTTVGTPVVAFGGYYPAGSPPATTNGIFATGPLVMYRGDIDTREMAIDKAINRVSYVAQRDYVIGWDCTCISATVRLAPDPV
jgi:hypothetical protein